VRLNGIRLDFKPLECFLVYDVCGVILVNEDLGHHKVGNYDGDNHVVILVNWVDTFQVSINESDRRENSRGW